MSGVHEIHVTEAIGISAVVPLYCSCLANNTWTFDSGDMVSFTQMSTFRRNLLPPPRDSRVWGAKQVSHVTQTQDRRRGNGAHVLLRYWRKLELYETTALFRAPISFVAGS
jgi:hypothetical protein